SQITIRDAEVKRAEIGHIRRLLAHMDCLESLSSEAEAANSQDNGSPLIVLMSPCGRIVQICMALAAGTKLGPHEIIAPIGAGGMGEVYRARDTRLDRIVAVKISREKFSERFEGEARFIAALNHPHICQLYDVGPDYLVM